MADKHPQPRKEDLLREQEQRNIPKPAPKGNGVNPDTSDTIQKLDERTDIATHKARALEAEMKLAEVEKRRQLPQQLEEWAKHLSIIAGEQARTKVEQETKVAELNNRETRIKQAETELQIKETKFKRYSEVEITKAQQQAKSILDDAEKARLLVSGWIRDTLQTFKRCEYQFKMIKTDKDFFKKAYNVFIDWRDYYDDYSAIKKLYIAVISDGQDDYFLQFIEAVYVQLKYIEYNYANMKMPDLAILEKYISKPLELKGVITNGKI